MMLPDIRVLLPHAGPMALLERLVEAADDTLCAEVRIGADSMFYADGGVGSWVGVEYMAQAVAAHAGYLAHRKGDTVKPGFLLGSRRYSTTRPLFPLGALLRVHVRQQLRGDNGLAAFECHIADADGVELASAMLTVFQPDDVNEFLQGINKNE